MGCMTWKVYWKGNIFRNTCALFSWRAKGKKKKNKLQAENEPSIWVDMGCTVALRSFFDCTSAEFRKMKNFNLIQTHSDWCISQGILLLCPCSWCVLVPFPCADIFISMWELHSNSELKHHILQVLSLISRYLTVAPLMLMGRESIW